jgi:phytanoyl-CoA hydroxylase
MKLTPEQIAQFREEGYLVAEGVVTNDDLAPLIGAYEAWIDRRARQLHAEGKITQLHEDAPFETRFGLLHEQCKEIENGLDIMHARLPEAFHFLRNENLLDAVECLVGPEITCSPIQHIRGKAPAKSSGTGAGYYNVPWHQDSGVTWDEADHSEIVTCWLALVDATVENGCMEVLPGAWKLGHLTHQAEGGTTIRPDLMPDMAPVAVPVKKGGIVFMHRHTPHRSTPNFTHGVRWSLDMRFQPTGTPTGRPFHPAFVVRSRQNPQSVLTNYEEWNRLWAEALSKPAPAAHRVK